MSRDYVKNQRSSRTMSQSSTTSGPSGMVWLLVGVLMGLIIAGVFYVKNQHSIPKDEAALPNTTQPATQQTKSPTSQNTTTSNQNLQTQFDFYNVLPSQKIVGPSGDEDTSEINNQNDSINNPAPTNSTTQSQSTSPDTSQQNATQQTSTQQNANQVSSPTTTSSPSSTTSTATPATPPVSSSNTNNQNNQSTNTTSTTDATSNKATHTTTVTSSDTTTETQQTAPAKEQNYILQIATFSQFTAADQLKAQLSLAGFEVNISQIQHDGKAMERVWVGPFHTQDEAAAVQKQLQDNQISSKLLKSS